MAAQWTKGSGKLGAFAPLIGSWVAEANSPMGAVTCTRVFAFVLGDNYVQLNAHWQFGAGPNAMSYDEIALYGIVDGRITFWSFTSDGQRSDGALADTTELHAESIGFEANMPAGLARMAYWPAEDGSMHWAADARTHDGWTRMTEHLYHRQTS